MAAKESQPVSKLPDPGQKEEVAQLKRELIANHSTWWWTTLLRAKCLQFFVPWPFDLIFNWLAGKRLKQQSAEIRGSFFFSASIALSIYATSKLGVNAARDARIASDGARALVSGALVLGTMLSVSVALPGQAIIRTLLKKDPIAAIDFVVPFMWALMWGLTGAVALTLYGGIIPPTVVVFLGIYGALMEVNALVNAIRMYLVGLVLHSDEP